MTETYIDPSRENFEVFKSLPRDRPIHMLNLIKFRDLAAYPEDHPNHGKGLSGAEAYAIYRKAFQALVKNSGAAMVWEAPMECVVTGPPGEWDEAFVMGYPDAKSFFAMVKDENYAREALPHRTAAVLDSRLIRFMG
ncbi:MAG: DUF1330 domain-containing protein [Novosphingobium sp. 17-62-19]|uniref:DUF1330 domain-containing protein n=1 Tax=Novosphingobium sp. 17-62-19 TaxID=1970406 RepID=UPI000BD9F5D1|nr:DUF1330 domain-containing protein [Novosphingobium sp. 17-62-19]OYX90754.1 MAG: DUF1330 domain-containing protein [Novosphingobium sp. 35-62-5]OZA18535.1 MAG: DUF1330 domain-containing protein [Novosphingobium sp. 17-62-19]HQS97678.1 DUF1330 domain-containing protein [Novosphingobium sp.]